MALGEILELHHAVTLGIQADQHHVRLGAGLGCELLFHAAKTDQCKAVAKLKADLANRGPAKTQSSYSTRTPETPDVDRVELRLFAKKRVDRRIALLILEHDVSRIHAQAGVLVTIEIHRDSTRVEVPRSVAQLDIVGIVALQPALQEIRHVRPASGPTKRRPAATPRYPDRPSLANRRAPEVSDRPHIGQFTNFLDLAPGNVRINLIEQPHVTLHLPAEALDQCANALL